MRTGIVLAAFLGLVDIVFGGMQVDPTQVVPAAVGIFLIVAGVGTIAAAPFAWRGAPWARYVMIVLRLLSAMTGLPAFFIPGIPAGFVVAAAVGIVLAVLVAVLMLLNVRAPLRRGTRGDTRRPSDVRALDRWAAALLMPIGPAAVAVLRFVIPPHPIGESVAANPDSQRLVLAFGVVAILTLLPGAFAAVRLVRLYAPILSVWTAAFLIPGYLGMTALLATDAVAMAGTDLGMDPAMVTRLNAAVLALPSVDILLSIFILGHIAGVVLLGVAAYHERLMPRLVALLLTVSQPLHLTAVLLASPEPDLLAWGLTTLGMAYLA